MAYTREQTLIRERFEESPPVKWESLFEEIASTTGGDWIEITRNIDARIEWLARLSSYLDARGAGSTHEKAVSASNARTKKVRKALGYLVTHDIQF